MNAASRNSNTGRSTSMFVGILVFILVLAALYYLYQYLYGTASSSSASIVLIDGLLPITREKAVIDSYSGMAAAAISDISGVMDGGAFSVNFWMYISDTKVSGVNAASSLIHIMDISHKRFAKNDNPATTVAPSGGSAACATAATANAACAASQTPQDGSGGSTLVYIGLNPVNGSLIVRESTSDSTTVNAYQIHNSFGASPKKNLYSVSSLESGYNNPSSVYQLDNRCDIVNGVEYQRWLMISVVGNGRTLDVYLDGKLARSCVYAANNYLGSQNGSAKAMFAVGQTLATPSILKGFFASGGYYSSALTPDLIWQLYQQGPTTTSSGWSSFLTNVFSTNLVIGSTTTTKQ